MDLTESLEVYIQVPIKKNALQIISQLSKGVFRLEDLVSSMETYLLSEKLEFRLNGLKLLSDIIHYWRNNLNTQELTTFADFYKSKLKDRFILMEQVLSGIMYLIKIKTLGDDAVMGLLQRIFSELQIPALPQRARFYAHSIILQTLTLHLPAAMRMGGDLVYGFIQAIDGEIDPRNLMLAFQSVPLITRSLPITLLLEELFEVVSCYFPVDFESTTEVEVTREELAAVLSAALSSTPLFSISLLPILLEKLNSDVLTAKMDSIRLINEVMHVYGGARLKGYTEAIWYGLKDIIFLAKSTEIELQGLKAVRQLVLTLSEWNAQEASQFVDKIIKDTTHHLLEADLRLISPSMRILIAASCTPSTFSHVGNSVLPLILIENANCADNVMVLRSLSEFIAVLVTRDVICDTELSTVNLVKMRIFPSILDTLQGQLAQPGPNTQYIASLLNSLLSIPNCLSNDEVLSIMHTYLDVLLVSNVNENSELLTGLSKWVNSTEFTGIHIQLIARVQDMIMEQHGKEAVYRILTCVCANFGIAKEVIPISIQTALSCDSNSMKLCIENLVNVWKNRSGIRDFHELYSQSVLQPLLQSSTQRDCSEDIMSLFRIVFVDLSSELQRYWIETLYQEYLLKKTAQEISKLGKFSFISVIFASSAIHMIEPYISSLLSISYEIIKVESEPFGAELFSSLVNKLPESDIPKQMARIDNIYSDLIQQQYPRTLKSYGTIVKGLLVRSYPDSLDLSLKILNLFPSPTLGEQAVDSFVNLLVDRSSFLSRGTNSNINLFYKQQFYLSVIHRVLEGFSNSVDDVRQRYLNTIVVFIQTLPIQVISADLSRLLDSLLACLDASNPNFSSKLVRSIFQLLIQSPDMVKSQLDMFLPSLYSLVSYPREMLVRLDSLAMLRALAHSDLFSYKKNMLEVIQKSLSDKKRIVRREAVMCATTWYMVLPVEKI